MLPGSNGKCKVSLSAATSSFKWADTAALIKVSFLAAGTWSTFDFFRGSQLGVTEKQDFELAGSPSKVRLFMGDSVDGWGFRQIEIATPDRKLSCMLASGTG